MNTKTLKLQFLVILSYKYVLWSSLNLFLRFLKHFKMYKC